MDAKKIVGLMKHFHDLLYLVATNTGDKELLKIEVSHAMRIIANGIIKSIDQEGVKNELEN